MKHQHSQIEPGFIFTNNQGSNFQILKRSDKLNAFGYKSSWDIKFLDKVGYETTAAHTSILLGHVKNPFQPRIEGVGYIGVGAYSSRFINEHGNVKESREYKKWRNMLERCYHLNNYNSRPSYEGCTVDEKWHNFQNFAEWYVKQIGHDKGWHVDKDLLIKGNKVYSENTCILLPIELNTMLTEPIKKYNKDKLPKGYRYSPNGSIRASLNLSDRKMYSKTFTNLDEAIKWRNNEMEKYIEDKLIKYAGLLEPSILELLSIRLRELFLTKY